MAEIALRLRIHGKVQGVGYREWALRQARALHLHGWVRNRLDGTVELLAVGEEAQVRELVAQCHEGPPSAEVGQVEEFAAQGIVPRDGFVRKPTV